MSITVALERPASPAFSHSSAPDSLGFPVAPASFVDGPGPNWRPLAMGTAGPIGTAVAATGAALCMGAWHDRTRPWLGPAGVGLLAVGAAVVGLAARQARWDHALAVVYDLEVSQGPQRALVASAAGAVLSATAVWGAISVHQPLPLAAGVLASALSAGIQMGAAGRMLADAEAAHGRLALAPVQRFDLGRVLTQYGFPIGAALLATGVYACDRQAPVACAVSHTVAAAGLLAGMLGAVLQASVTP